jgi:hypothetical protein
MAFEADQRLGLGRKVANLQELFRVTLLVFFCVLDCQATSAMTGFTVDQWQPGIGSDLATVNRMLKVGANLVMGMAFGQTVVIADIVGHQVADHQAFIFLNWLNRVRLSQGAGFGTGGQE